MIHSRIIDHFIDRIIVRLYLMTFYDYVMNRLFSMWRDIQHVKMLEKYLYKISR
jgi:hypothetical protein